MKEPLKEHFLADYLRKEAPTEIAASLHNPAFMVEGSPGRGNWAEIPWIAIFDPVVTTTATQGYYPVYLFSADMSSVYLSLNQGTTSVRKEFKAGTHEELGRLAALMRARLPEAAGRFSQEPITLNGVGELAEDYEAAAALSAQYSINALPSEEVLEADLKDMARLYSMLVSRGGRENFEDIGDSEAAKNEGDTIIERRRYRYHRKIERSSKVSKQVKKIHGHTCQCCGFNFSAVYGPKGEEYIEAHHLIPLSELPEDTPVAQDPAKDFAVLCANCHRMVHRKGSPDTLDALRRLPGVLRLVEQFAKQYTDYPANSR